MSTEQNKANTHRSIEEGFNKRDLGPIVALAVDTHVSHTTTGEAQSLAEYKQFLTAFFVASPYLHFTIDDLLADGDKTITRWTARGTHSGNLMGIPPTEKQATMTGISISRWVDGKAAETWISFDNLHLLQQLGVVPNLAKAR